MDTRDSCHKHHIMNTILRMHDTGLKHRDKKGRDIARIFILMPKKSNYSNLGLRSLRAIKGVGNVRKIIK